MVVLSKPYPANCDGTFSSEESGDEETGDMGPQGRRVFISENGDVRYFNMDAPPAQVGNAHVAQDGSVTVIEEDEPIYFPPPPLHIRFQRQVRKIFRKRIYGKTIVEWMGKCFLWTGFTASIAAMGYIIVHCCE